MLLLLLLLLPVHVTACHSYSHPRFHYHSCFHSLYLSLTPVSWERVLPEGGMGMFFFWKLLLFLLSFVFLLMPPPLADSSTAAVRSGPRVHGVAQGSEPAPGACLTTLVLYRPPNFVTG